MGSWPYLLHDANIVAPDSAIHTANLIHEIDMIPVSSINGNGSCFDLNVVIGWQLWDGLVYNLGVA